jgi:phosphatidylserine/phosphatidylglycerophosphate/cardiolipin synthase-like enzyme
MWVGDERKGIEPWRDTGIEIRGPAVAELERAFPQMWAACGQPIPAVEFTDSISPIRLIQDDGNVALRIVASMPYSAGLYRLDQMIAAAAHETLWLTDAYFAGTTPYIQALSAASRDGVDVRLLVPQATDIPVVRALSRLEHTANRIVLGILAAAFIAGLATVLSVYRPPGWENWAGVMFAVGFFFALALGIYLAWSILRSGRS